MHLIPNEGNLVLVLSVRYPCPGAINPYAGIEFGPCLPVHQENIRTLDGGASVYLGYLFAVYRNAVRHIGFGETRDES
jgi:hypothetical protein